MHFEFFSFSTAHGSRGGQLDLKSGFHTNLFSALVARLLLLTHAVIAYLNPAPGHVEPIFPGGDWLSYC